jgi:hypothetical protein
MKDIFAPRFPQKRHNGSYVGVNKHDTVQKTKPPNDTTKRKYKDGNTRPR